MPLAKCPTVASQLICETCEFAAGAPHRDRSSRDRLGVERDPDLELGVEVEGLRRVGNP